MKIKRLLIANRGEIAVRIARTARRLGITSIAVYSSVDKNALHVKAADEALLIGDAPPADSYLNMDRIMEAARRSGADAIHSGYGFLAENPEFAERCLQESLIFVGPPADAIRTMGMKGLARERMREAGVPVLPGVDHVRDEHFADEIGYPLMIKPEAGGGGKGMKIVREPGELKTALEAARREARSSFGNDALMAEKYLEAPRHIEIQVFADNHGNCVHLNERDCSLQRRHQKIVEESPAPHYPDERRQAMGAAAVDAARAIGYVGAGTVEFLLGAGGEFYFMEMNTRLQVEHPVTEAITGFDLVEWQLRIAAGEALPASQQEIVAQGHAIEARLYAEDPANDFLPASGRITHLELPPAGETLRIDNGVDRGDLIGVFYDPMLMKLIAKGPDRPAALTALRRALEQTRIAGITTNRDFLLAVLKDRDFEQGNISTDWLDHRLDAAFEPPGRREIHLALSAVAVHLLYAETGDDPSPWHTARNFRLNQSDSSRLLLTIAGEQYWTTLSSRGEELRVATEDEAITCTFISASPLVFREAATTHEYHIVRDGTRFHLFTPIRSLLVELPADVSGAHREEEGNVQAPMSGKIVSILVSAGDTVDKGDPLVIIEAMKMEHTVYAPAAGTVDALFFVEQDLVNEGTELLEFTPAAS